MTPHEFITKWRASALKERSASQEHFIDLCRLLDEPTPAEADPAGERVLLRAGRPQGYRRGRLGGRLESGITSPGSTRASAPTWTPRSGSSASMRWRWRTRRC